MNITTSKKELCQKYNISYKTLAKWLLLVDGLDTKKRIFTPLEIEKIENKIGKIN